MKTKERVDPALTRSSDHSTGTDRTVADRRGTHGSTSKLDVRRGLGRSTGIGSPSALSVMVSRLKPGRSTEAHRALLQLQRQHGNRRLQKTLDVARQSEEEEEAAGFARREAGAAHAKREVAAEDRANGEPIVPPDVERAIDRKRGGGRTLDGGVCKQMEDAFDADFGDVRIHRDEESDTLNRALNARAFTVGRDIFFGRGEYRPSTSEGKELLAHELTHVIQQRDAAARKDLRVLPSEHPLERTADETAATVVRNLSRPAALRDSRRGRATVSRDNGDDDGGREFTPAATTTIRWSAEVWDTMFIDEKLADMSVTYIDGVDRNGRRQLWGIRASHNKYKNLIDVGRRVQTNRIGNEMELYFEFRIVGANITVTNTESAESGVSAGVESGGVSIGFTSGTTVTHTYSMSGPGTSGTMSRSYRVRDGNWVAVQQDDFPSDLCIKDAEGNSEYCGLEVRRERNVNIV